MNNLIIILFKDDIYKELSNYKNNYNLSDEEYEKFCKNRINKYIDQIKIKNITINKKLSLNLAHNQSILKCNARLWSDGYGSQCSHAITKNNLCKKHNNIIEKYGKLRFDKISDQKPIFDLIKGNKLPWK